MDKSETDCLGGELMRRVLFAPLRFLLRRRRLPAGLAGALVVLVGGVVFTAIALVLFT